MHIGIYKVCKNPSTASELSLSLSLGPRRKISHINSHLTSPYRKNRHPQEHTSPYLHHETYLPTYPPTMSTSLSTLTTTTTTMLLFILTSGIIQPTHATVSNCYTQSNVTVICEFPDNAVDPDCKVSNLACPPTECLVGYTQEEWFCDRWQGWGCSYAVCCVFVSFFFLFWGA